MIDFFCKLWPYLAGGLIGWLLAGWFARKLKHSEPPIEVEKIVEKTIDNPQHVALISKLEKENKEIAGLKTKISGFETSAASAKTVDNPIHLKKIGELETELSSLKNTTNNTPQAALSGTTTTVDNPDHLKRISELEVQVKSLQQGQMTDLPTSQKSNLASNASLTTNDTRIAKPSTDGLDKEAAKAASFRVKSEEGRDDFTIVEGIDPKINDLIHDAGIHTYTELGGAKVEKLQQILDAAGSSYSLAKPGTWPAQADMAATNKWEALKVWQNELDGGV